VQAYIECDDLMAEKPIDSYRLDRIDEAQKKLGDRFDKLDGKLEERFLQISKDLGKIQGAQEKPPSKWFTHVAAPVLVAVTSAAIIAAAPAYINLSNRLSSIEVYIRDNGGFIAGLRLQQSAVNPTDPKDVSTVKNVLETAKAKKTKIDPIVVESVGKKFVEAGAHNPDTWDVAMALVSYRSYLNSRPTFADRPIATSPQGTMTEIYDTQNILNKGTSQMYSVGLGTPDNRAEFRHIGLPDANEGHHNPNAFLLFDKTEVLLDNLYARNVIFENSHIVYKGGPVVLYNVTFVNCTFDVIRRNTGQEFAERILEPSSSTNFQVG
jgi:hypothetical protein